MWDVTHSAAAEPDSISYPSSVNMFNAPIRILIKFWKGGP